MSKTVNKVATKKKTPATKKTSAKAVKISITLDKEDMEDLTLYLKGIGISKEAFAILALKEKLSRDKISSMIDTMVR